MRAFGKFLKNLLNVDNKVAPEPTFQDPCQPLEPRIGLLNIPLTAQAWGYNRSGLTSEEIDVVARCICNPCQDYASIPHKDAAHRKYNAEKYATKFAPIKYRKVKGDPKISYRGLDEAFQFEYIADPKNPNAILGVGRRVKSVNVEKLLRIVTYVKPVIGKFYRANIYDLVMSCSYFYDIDLEAALDKYGNQMSKDFTRKIMILFVQSWEAFSSGNRMAEYCAFQMRRFLTHILGFPQIAAEVFEIITTPEFWPEMGPIPIFEALFERYLCCIHTASLLCNLTRIPQVAEYLITSTKCFFHLRNNRGFMKALNEREELGLLLLNLLVNLVPYKGFAKFFMENVLKDVVYPLITLSSAESSMEKVVWPLLRNFVMTDEGRRHVMENLSDYLGLILFPISGSEELTSEEMSGLPEEVLWLMESKARVEDRTVRESILDIIFLLCRFKEDREKLRNAKTSVILKYYQLAEKDTQLLEKIQVVVDLLTPKETHEIEVDDLLENTSFEDQTNKAATSGRVIVRPTDAFP